MTLAHIFNVLLLPITGMNICSQKSFAQTMMNPIQIASLAMKNRTG
jgi:hypothetical protein